MIITVDDFKEIRNRYLNGESQRKIARELGIARKTVKKYCEGGSVPGERKTPIRKATVVTEEVVNFIENCLKEDEKEGQKKQKLTAKKIYDRLVSERNFKGGESTIRQKVSEIRGRKAKGSEPLIDPDKARQMN